MKRLACHLLIASLILSPAFAAETTLISGAVSLHRLANILGIEVSLATVEQTLKQKAEGDPIFDSLTLKGAAEAIGLDLLERNFGYTHLQVFGRPVIVSFKTAFDDQTAIPVDSTVVTHFVVVEEASEKWVRIFGTSHGSLRAAATIVPRERFLELWTGQTLTPLYALSREATQLLAHVKTGTDAYKAKLKSGEIAFTITLSQATDKPLPADAVTYIENGHRYEETGYWHIIYRFDGERQFYDVKTRKKMEFHGQSLQDWQETHHRFRIENRRLHFSEKIGTEWKHRLPQNMPSRLLEPHFNPHWWSWPLWNLKLTDLFRFFKPIDVKQVDVEGPPHYLLTGHRTKRDWNSVIEIWLDPQKEYRPTRVLTHRRSTLKAPVAAPDGQRKPATLEIEYNLTRHTYQLAQFEPDIWFPQTVIREVSFNSTNEKEHPPPTFRKITMQVHRAVFNIPISEKELGITPDR